MVGLWWGRERAALNWTVGKLIIHFSADSFVHFNAMKNVSHTYMQVLTVQFRQ